MDYPYSAHADQMLNGAMDKLDSELQSAESRFESDGSFLEIKAKYANCNDMCVLADIVAESNRITSELYASYEALIRAANSICKPFADEGVQPKTLKRVVDFMEHINAECSTLGSNFSASVNDYSLGNVASTRYSPSAEARMIETNWKLLHSMHPQVAEEKRLADEAAAKAKAEREERGRIEREKAIEEYPQKLAEWEAENERVSKLRQELYPQAEAEARKRHIQKAARERNQRIFDLEAERDNLRAEMQELEHIITTAKFFEFAKKLEANQRVQQIAPRLGQLEQLVARLRSEPLESEENFARSLESELRKAREKVEEEHPLPRKPRDPNAGRGAFEASDNMTAVQRANLEIKQAIYETLQSYDRGLCITDIMMYCDECASISNQRCSALVRQLVTDGLVERYEIKRMAYFRVAE